MAADPQGKGQAGPEWMDHTRALTEVPAAVSTSVAPGGQASGPRFPGRAGAGRCPCLGSRCLRPV